MSRRRLDETTRIHEEHRNVETVRSAFDARWTMSALERVDRELAERLRSQVSKFHKSLLMSELDEVQKHGAATVRGYRRAIETMDTARAEPDAYLVGQDSQSGLRVVVSRTNATLTNPPADLGENVFIVQVDELARLFASTPNLAFIAAVAKAVPGCGVYVHHTPIEPTHWQAASEADPITDDVSEPADA